MANGRPWETWEIVAIATLPAGGIAELAQTVGRTYGSVVLKRWKLGLGECRAKWIEAETIELDRLLAGGMSVEGAARKMGRARSTAYRQHRGERV